MIPKQFRYKSADPAPSVDRYGSETQPCPPTATCPHLTASYTGGGTNFYSFLSGQVRYFRRFQVIFFYNMASGVYCINSARETRDRGSTRSASARRREGDRFESRSDTAS